MCNKSNSAIWTKLIGIIEDYSGNISVVKKSKNKCREIHVAKTAAFHFSHYISMENYKLSYQPNR